MNIEAPIEEQTSSPKIYRRIPPRVWPSFTVLALAIVGMLLGSILSVFIIFLIAPQPLTYWLKRENIERYLSTLLQKPVGLAIMALPTQLVLFFAALIPALLSKEGFLKRLGLVKWSVSTSVFLIAIIGTLGLSLPVDLLATALFGKASDHLSQLHQAIHTPSGIYSLFPYLLIGIIPGICEELLFRGYIQSRLLKRYPVYLAIAIPTLSFSLIHFDPMHIFMTLLPAIWLAYIAYKTGSVWTSIFAHILNNSVSVFFTRLMPNADASSVDAPLYQIVFFGLCSIILIIAAIKLIKLKAPCYTLDYLDEIDEIRR